MKTPRDSNHTVRFFYIKGKRLFRDNARTPIQDLWNDSVDALNSLVRSVLGLLIVTFSLLNEICKKSQVRWRRKEAGQ